MAPDVKRVYAIGLLEVTAVTLCWRALGNRAWQSLPMHCQGRRTYATTLTMPWAGCGIEYYLQAEFADYPARCLVTDPPGAPATRYLISS